MKTKYVWLVVNCLIIVSLLIASCGGGTEEKEKVTSGDEPQYGGVLTVIGQDFGSDDPADALNATNTQCSYMNETLLLCDWTWTPEQCGFYGVEMDSITDPEK